MKVEEQLMQADSLALFLRRHANPQYEDALYCEDVFEYQVWAQEHPDKDALFREKLAQAIVHAELVPQDLRKITGRVEDHAPQAAVDEQLRTIWFELFGPIPIPGDKHPLPDWWFKWVASTFITVANFFEDDDPADFEHLNVPWFLETHDLTMADVRNAAELFDALTQPDGNLRRYAGYRRMMRARWEDGDRTPPSLPVDPADLAEAEEWFEYWPGPSA